MIEHFPWYVFSIIAVMTAVPYDLCQKKALNLGANQNRLLFYTFFGEFMLYFIYNLPHFSQLMLRPDIAKILALGILVGALSFLANIYLMKALAESPNAGYPKAVNSANALLITIASFLLFGSPINLVKLAGIIVIVLGLLPLLIDHVKAKGTYWFADAFIGMIFVSAMILVTKYLNNLYVSPAQILMLLFFFASLAFGFKDRLENENPVTSKKAFRLIVIAVFLAFISNLANFTAVKLAPNPGYSQAIMNTQVIFIMLFSSVIFTHHTGGEFHAQKWFGVIVVIAGAILIIFGT